MNLKSQLLEIFERSRGVRISGGELARGLSVSRSAVWKAVSALRAEGYEISAVTNGGYRLEDSGDILSAEGIASQLKHEGIFKPLVFNTLPSTNKTVREMAETGAAEGLVVAAGEQTAGRGRLGRSFYSPAGCGIYFSLLLRPNAKADIAALVTSAAAVAAARAIEGVTGVQAGIKWVNDLFAGGKKVCGILTEASFDMESGLVESAVLGIGINIAKPEDGFPAGLEEVAGALMDGRQPGIRNRLIAAVLDDFWPFYKNLAAKEFLEEYRNRSFLLGQDILVLSDGLEGRKAKALSIDDECRLVVRYDDNETAALNSGEVSIRARNAS